MRTYSSFESLFVISIGFNIYVRLADEMQFTFLCILSILNCAFCVFDFILIISNWLLTSTKSLTSRKYISLPSNMKIYTQGSTILKGGYERFRIIAMAILISLFPETTVLTFKVKSGSKYLPDLASPILLHPWKAHGQDWMLTYEGSHTL